MQFRLWIETWLHGTKSGDMIREQGFTPSTAGGGQRGLMGVWLTQDQDYASVYANLISGIKGRPEVLAVNLPQHLNIADLVKAESSMPSDITRSLWAFVGLDIEKDEDTALIRSLQPFALTKVLQKQGYDGALIPNTVRKDGPPELVIFDPSKVSLSE